MGFLLPSALAFAGLAIPIIIFYMLKLRRRPARVSSLMLWQQVIQDRQANAPWQRIRRNLLLLLQLLILALLVLALARPYFNVAAAVQGNVVILLDASASMQATDVVPTRFAVAQNEARSLIDRLSASDAVTLIAVESTPRILASSSTDHGSIRRSLTNLEPSSAPADWDSALTLAAANAGTLPDASVVIISDGGLNTSFNNETETLPTLPAEVEFITIGQSQANQGLVALALREGPEGPEVFLRAINADSQPTRRLVEVQVDGQLFDARWLDIPAKGSANLTLSGLPLTTQQVTANLQGEDILAADDTAWTVRSTAPIRVLIVGPGNLFLERALALVPDLTLQRATPEQSLPETPFDLVIFDRVDMDQVLEDEPVPDSSLLFIAPPSSTSLFQVTGTISQTRITNLNEEDPVLAYVKLNTTRVAQAQAVQPPPWGRTLVQAEDGPLLITGQTEQQRAAILTFDLHQSDLPLQIDFPILMVNLARWLLPTSSSNLGQAQSLQAQQGINLPGATTAENLLIRTPTEEFELSPAERQFNETNQLGIYQILAKESDQPEPRVLNTFAVNLLAESETNLQPQTPNFGTEQATVTDDNLVGQREWWWLAIALGLVVLLIEWWVYWRGEVR